MSDNPKKAINAAIKRKISKDDTFKEFYTDLTDKEKENFKKRYTDYTEFHNLIVEKQKYSGLNLQNTAQIMFEEAVLKKGYKKTHSKKAKIYAKNRKFVFKWKDYWLGICPTDITKKGYVCSFIFLLEISTEKGKIYVDIPGDGFEDQRTSHVVFTAHFFDRYQERLNIVAEDRNEVIKTFLKHELIKDKASGIDVDSKGNSIYVLSKGLGLGRDLGKMVLNKTFISEDEANRYQQITKEQLDLFVEENSKKE